MTIRVVLGEDGYLVREGIERVLAASPDLELVGSCGDFGVLREMIDTLLPDVVLTDIRMPPTQTDEGIRLATELRATHPEIGVVVLSQHASTVYANALFAEGADGRAYVLKERIANADELVRIIRDVAAGGTFLDHDVIQLVLADRHDGGGERLRRLTPREHEVLALVAAGYTNAAVAEKLSIGKRGVERHLNAIFGKLELGDSEHVSRRVVAVLEYLGSR